MEGTIRIALCDDEIIFLEQLSRSIKKVMEKQSYHVSMETFSCASALQEELEQGKAFDLYFLDIDIPRINGIELGRQIRQTDSNAMIIFVSAKEELVFDALTANPFQFIRKRYLEKDFHTVFPQIWSELEQRKKQKSLVFEVGQVNYRLDVRRTMYIEATGKYLNIYQTDKMFYVRYQISMLEEKLKEYGFLRIHKSYLVNPAYIYLLEPGKATLENRTCLPVSRHRYAEIQKQFRDYMLEGAFH